MKKITIRFLTSLFAAFALIFAIGCEGDSGFGDDVEDAGDEVEDAADEAN